MLDLQRAISTLGCVAEAHVISVKGECKDLILVLTAESGVSTRITCSEGAHRLTFTQEEEQAALPEYTAEMRGIDIAVFQRNIGNGFIRSDQCVFCGDYPLIGNVLHDGHVDLLAEPTAHIIFADVTVAGDLIQR